MFAEMVKLHNLDDDDDDGDDDDEDDDDDDDDDELLAKIEGRVSANPSLTCFPIILGPFELYDGICWPYIESISPNNPSH